MDKYPKPATKQYTLKILEQLDNYFCKIEEKKIYFKLDFFVP